MIFSLYLSVLFNALLLDRGSYFLSICQRSEPGKLFIDGFLQILLLRLKIKFVLDHLEVLMFLRRLFR